jgi:hypothetical protein
VKLARPLAVLAALLALAGPLAAQEAPRERRQERRAARRDEMFRMVDAYIAMNIEEKLGLSDEQFGRVLPLVKRLQSDRRRFAEQRMERLRDLKDRLQSGAATEPQVAQVLRELKSMEDEEPATLRKDRDAIDQMLTIVQQAKLRVLELEVERKIRALTQQQRLGAAGGPGSGRPPAPDDEPR